MAIALGDLDFNSLTNFGTTMDLSLDVASDDDFIIARVGGEIGFLTSVVLDPGGSDEAAFSTAVEEWHSISTTLVANVMYLRAADVPTPGTYTVRLTVNAGADCGFSVRALKGVKDEAPEATASSEVTADDVIQTEITTLTDDAWIFDSVVCSQDSDPAWTPDSGQAEEYDIFASGHTEAGSYESKASAGAETQGWTNARSNQNQCHALVSLAPAAGDILLAAQLVSEAVLTADLDLAQALAAAVAASGGLVADLDLVQSMVAAIAAGGSITANLEIAETLKAAVTAGATLSADLDLVMSLASQLAADAVVQGTLTWDGAIELLHAVMVSHQRKLKLRSAAELGHSRLLDGPH